MCLTNREMMFYRAFRNRQCVAARKAEMGPEVYHCPRRQQSVFHIFHIDDVTRLPNLHDNIAHVSALHPTSTAHYL